MRRYYVQMKPELLLPAGNLEKLKIALTFGADAVFVGTPIFGLRKHAPNFTLDELADGIAFAHTRQKKVYVVLNSFAHDVDLNELAAALPELAAVKPDAFIISDMGVAQLVLATTNIPVHVSTQASVTNAYGCQFWKDAGAKRVILAREVSIAECRRILEQVDIELEIFVHGSMCASYSGKCVISNYTAARDSNRGGCVQSCRHKFGVHDQKTGAFEGEHNIMNAKDLMGARLIPEMIDAVIASFKIEGRMKSNLYAAQTAYWYRQAIDHPERIDEIEAELATISNRTFNDGFLSERPYDSCNTQFNGYTKGTAFLGSIKTIKDGRCYAHVKSPFESDIDIFSPNGQHYTLSYGSIQALDGNPIERLKPNMMIQFPTQDGLAPQSILTTRV